MPRTSLSVSRRKAQQVLYDRLLLLSVLMGESPKNASDYHRLRARYEIWGTESREIFLNVFDDEDAVWSAYLPAIATSGNPTVKQAWQDAVRDMKFDFDLLQGLHARIPHMPRNGIFKKVWRLVQSLIVTASSSWAGRIILIMLLGIILVVLLIALSLIEPGLIPTLLNRTAS